MFLIVRVCGSGRFLCGPLYLAVFYTSVFHEVDKVPWVSFSFIRDLVRAFLCTNDKGKAAQQSRTTTG